MFVDLLHWQSDISTILSTIILEISSKICSRITLTPSIITTYSGMLILVPGGLAVSAFLENQNGINLAAEVLRTSLSIAVGILFASMLVKNTTTGSPLKF
jgi:uncharacterized membrane protein YjjB (DUF3815 family)